MVLSSIQCPSEFIYLVFTFSEDEWLSFGVIGVE
jgi:hypothetical protein